MKRKYSTAPAGAREDFDLIEVIRWHQFTVLARSLAHSNPGFLRAFGEVAIQKTRSDKGWARPIFARLAPAPKPSERAKAESAYQTMAEGFNAGPRHRERLAELLIETVSDIVSREGVR